ncbi:hypothetical protein [Sediminibacterium sp. C3]|uniref:hypothetical protein n=1 Tax=Sediminibacterium sp. C3 TaxID=1267211 RepID=UPI00047A3315|nr:hypothetical protein [Sediminibacterium sp. C3]
MKLLSSFYGWVVILTFIGLVSCKSKTNSLREKKTALSDTAKFYPIEKFIQDEIQYVDLRDFIITETKLQESGDTVLAKNINSTKQLTKDEFISAATEINNSAVWFSKNKHLYKETVFQDLGTESYTINYHSEKADIKNINLLLHEQTNLPKRLFIRVISKEEENIITVQYSWTAGKQLTIAKSINKGKTLIWQSSHTIQWKKRP